MQSLSIRGFTIRSFKYRKFSSGIIKSFEDAKSALSSLNVEPDNSTKLRIYALYKQYTVGNCGPKPFTIDLVAKEKWQAWNSLKDMPREEASAKYIALIAKLLSKKGSETSFSPTLSDQTCGVQVTLSENGVLNLCLNRPEKKNALTWEMYEKWIQTLNDAATNPKVNMVTITGIGDYFSSGNDLANFVAPVTSGANLADVARSGRDVLQRFVAAFIDFPKILIGLINGPVVGVCFTTLALYDYILAVDNATFHAPFVSLGQTPEGCSSYTFPKIMGTFRANQVLLFGRCLTACDALQFGLVSEVVPKSDFQDRSRTLIDEILQLPKETLKVGKEVLRARERTLLHEVNEIECKHLSERWLAPECMDAVTGFLKR